MFGKQCRVLIVDDHAIVREGIIALLDARKDVAVVGEACNGREAFDKVEELIPDIVIMDLSMPSLNGLEAIAKIRARHPHCKIIVLTMHENKEYVRKAFKAGAAGYIVKQHGVAQLLQAVEAVHRGEAFFGNSISQVILEDFINAVGANDGTLSGREREILQLVVEGKSNKDIGRILCISVKTVEGHKDNIKKKLAVKDTAGLVAYAVREGIIHLDKLT